VLASYLLAAVLAAPYVYYLLTDFHSNAFHPPQDFRTDLLNFVVPTRLSLAGAGWAGAVARHFPGNDSERGAYLGVPTLVIVVLYAWRSLRSDGARLLVVLLLLAVLATLGTGLMVDGRVLAPLPWEHVGYLPLFDNVLVERLTLYASFVAAVMVALWTASVRNLVLRIVLPALAVLAIVPNPASHAWITSFDVPRFFAGGAYRACIARDDIVLPLPVSASGDANLWQVTAGFGFRMAGGYVASSPPTPFTRSTAVEQIALGAPVGAEQADWLRRYVAEKRVDAVVVAAGHEQQWASALDRLFERRRRDGVLVYLTGSRSGRC
jgi:hypothetical protein